MAAFIEDSTRQDRTLTTQDRAPGGAGPAATNTAPIGPSPDWVTSQVFLRKIAEIQRKLNSRRNQ